MKIVHNNSEKNDPGKKRVPMYKDEAYMTKFKAEFIAAHNKKIRKMIDNGTYDKWIGR